MFLHSLLQHFLAMMVPLHEASVFQTTKRKRITSAVATSTPGFPSRAPQDKKQLLHLSSRLSPEIWSNLSRIWLTRSAIQEFHRRKVQPARPKPKNWSDLKGYSAKELKSFAGRGVSSLCDLRGVGSSSLHLWGVFLLTLFSIRRSSIRTHNGFKAVSSRDWNPWF